MRMHGVYIAMILTVGGLTPSAAPDTERLNVAFLIWDGMELIESMGPAHVFSFAPGMDEYTVSASTDPIKSEFITIVPQYTLDNCPPPDVIVIPGGSIWIPRMNEAYGAWLRKHVPRSKLTVSVCNSAILLADLGLLDGKEATCANSNLDDIMLLGKDVKGYINRRWVHSGNIITSKSYLGGIDSAIYAVRVLRGKKGEEQVLGWSNYDGDLSKYDAMHAEPGIIPVSRRREIYKILMNDGVDAAVRRYREWVASGEPAYTPPLDRLKEPDMFQWMAWGNQRLGRHDISLKICEFKTKVWPDAAREHAYLGEALMKAGRLDEALTRLLKALEMDEENRPALVFTRRLLRKPDLVASDASQRARSILRRHPIHGRAVLVGDDEPGVPLTVSGVVRDANGRSIEGALLYVFHADAEGVYTKTRAMDEPNARLFAYLKTGADGRYEFETIRPGAYPGREDRQGIEWKLPAHIHFQIEAPGYEPSRFQMVFDNDPRMRPDYWQVWAQRDGNPIAAVEHDDDGSEKCSCNIVLEATTE